MYLVFVGNRRSVFVELLNQFLRRALRLLVILLDQLRAGTGLHQLCVHRAHLGLHVLDLNHRRSTAAAGVRIDLDAAHHRGELELLGRGSKVQVGGAQVDHQHRLGLAAEGRAQQRRERRGVVRNLKMNENNKILEQSDMKTTEYKSSV